MTERYPNFAKRLKASRVKARMSQRELSAKVGRSFTYICQMESGRWLPGGVTALNISRALDVPLEWLLTGEDPKGVK